MSAGNLFEVDAKLYSDTAPYIPLDLIDILYLLLIWSIYAYGLFDIARPYFATFFCLVERTVISLLCQRANTCWCGALGGEAADGAFGEGPVVWYVRTSWFVKELLFVFIPV